MCQFWSRNYPLHSSRKAQQQKLSSISSARSQTQSMQTFPVGVKYSTFSVFFFLCHTQSVSQLSNSAIVPGKQPQKTDRNEWVWLCPINLDFKMGRRQLCLWLLEILFPRNDFCLPESSLHPWHLAQSLANRGSEILLNIYYVPANNLNTFHVSFTLF